MAKKIANGAYRNLVLQAHRDAKNAIRKSLKAASMFYLSLDGTKEAKNYQCMIDVLKEIRNDDQLYKFLKGKTRQGMNKAGEVTGYSPFYLLQSIYKNRETINGKFGFHVQYDDVEAKQIEKDLEVGKKAA